MRSYIPAIGRFTSTDPIAGASANAYDYALADPINTFDLDGRKPRTSARMAGGRARLRVRSRKKRFRIRMRARFLRSRAAVVTLHKASISFERSTGCGRICLNPKGRFEAVSTAEFKPRVPNHSRWRDWGIKESYDCDPGTEYQYHIRLLYTVETVLGGIFRRQTKTLDLKAQTHCRG